MGTKLAYLRHFVNTDKGFWDGYYRPTLFTEYVLFDFSFIPFLSLSALLYLLALVYSVFMHLK